MTRLLIATTISSTINAFLLPFARHFRARGWKVDALTQQIPSATVDENAFDNVWDIDWSRNPLDPGNLLRCPIAIRKIVERECYDLVHVHTPVAAFTTRYALRGLRRSGMPRVIYTTHGLRFYQGGPPLPNALFLGLEKLAGAWTDYLVTINPEDLTAAKRYHLVPSERIWYMPGIGVDLKQFNPNCVSSHEVSLIRQELGLDQSDSLVLMLAEFIPRKRHADALKAFAQLARSNVHLAFAGNGPLFASIRHLADELGLSGRVHFLGQRRDVPTLIRTSVVTLLTSDLEGLPRSVMESLSLATPVIGTNIRGTRDLLAKAGGLLVDVGDIDGLARTMGWVLDNPKRAQLLGQQGRECMKDYDLQQIIAMHNNLYAQALSSTALQVSSSL